jgi:hypothetical protein
MLPWSALWRLGFVTRKGSGIKATMGDVYDSVYEAASVVMLASCGGCDEPYGGCGKHGSHA